MEGVSPRVQAGNDLQTANEDHEIKRRHKHSAIKPDVIREYYGELCDILNTNDGAFDTFTEELYSKRIIGKDTKLSVKRHRGKQGANDLLDSVELKIGHDSSYLQEVIKIMDSIEHLCDVAKKMKGEKTDEREDGRVQKKPQTVEGISGLRWEKRQLCGCYILIFLGVVVGVCVVVAVFQLDPVWKMEQINKKLSSDDPATLRPMRSSETNTDTDEVKQTQTTTSNDVVTTPDVEKRIWMAGETGSDVVKKCLEKLQETGIFPDDKDFMKRLAFVMSRNGDASFRLHNDGGIWQVSRFAFQDTKDEIAHVRLPKKYQKLQDALGIDWRAARRRDLEKPMYSAIAARLYLSNFAEPIPPSSQVQKQQNYWWRFYMMNHESKWSMDEEDYTHGVKHMSQK